MLFPTLAVILALTSGGRDDPAVDKERDRFQGKWTVVEVHVGASDLSQLADSSVDFEADKMFISRDGRRPRVGTIFTLDPSTSPGSIDLEDKSFDFKAKGIYEFEGKRLRICYNTKERPTKFDSEERENEPFNVLYELERVEE